VKGSKFSQEGPNEPEAMADAEAVMRWDEEHSSFVRHRSACWPIGYQPSYASEWRLSVDVGGGEAEVSSIERAWG
jgi:hypothetical protein